MFKIFTLLVIMEAGALPGYNMAMGADQYMADMWYSDVSIEVSAGDTFFANYSTRMDCTYLEKATVIPQSQTYGYTIGLRQWGIETGLRHLCQHPVQSLLASGVRSDQQLYRWQNELYVRWEGKFQF